MDLTIYLLNDDCLFKVFSYLDIRDIIAVGKICPRFKIISRMVIRRYKVLDFDEMALTHRTYFMDISKYLSRVGEHLHTFKASKASFIGYRPKETPYLKTQYIQGCRNVQSIYLYGFDMRDVRKHPIVFESAKKAVISKCWTKDRDIHIMFRHEQLEVLNVSKNPNIRGSFLGNLREIQELNLFSCVNVTSGNFKIFCDLNPKNLRSLNIVYCCELKGYNLRMMAENFLNLEELAISNEYTMATADDYLCLAGLPKITKLQISGSYLNKHIDIMDAFFREICAKNRLKRLELTYVMIKDSILDAMRRLSNLNVLQMIGVTNCRNSVLDAIFDSSETLQELIIPSCRDVTTGSLMRLYNRCPALRYMNLYKCRQISKSLIKEIVEIQKEKSTTLEIVINCTRAEKHLFGLDEVSLKNVKLTTKVSKELNAMLLY